ncbi:MAG: hypothetical protein HY675_06440 [Chloroflexi bacterium]|nr:hypothetical protein [Chloroflexota bacterium]
MDEIDFFVPEYGPKPPGILSAYLPSLDPGFVRAYVETYTREGDVVLDPFCRTDVVAREALRLKRKAILSAFNPINVFIARTAFAELTQQQLTHALLRLGEGDKLQSSLRAHLSDLYATTCPRCSQRATVSYFIWNRDDNRPTRKYYNCDSCAPGDGAGGLLSEAVNEADLQVLQAIEPRGFHYWQVLDRLAAVGQLQVLAKQALELYTPRNLYALATLLMHVESRFDKIQYQDILKLALLECLDSCSKLSVNPRQARPWIVGNALRPPARFIERNVWLAFEESYRQVCDMVQQGRREGVQARVASDAEQIVRPGPEPRPHSLPNLAVLRQSSRQLTDDIPESSVDLIVAEPPHPGSTDYATLSYVWTGWLFGREQAAIFDRFQKLGSTIDWPTYYRATIPRLRALSRVLREQGSMVLRFSSDEQALCNVLALAGAAAGLILRRILYEPLEQGTNSEALPPKRVRTGSLAANPFVDVPGHYCLHFAKSGRQVNVRRQGAGAQSRGLHSERAEEAGPTATVLARTASQAMRDALTERGEPMHYNWLGVLACEHLAREGMLANLREPTGQTSGDEGEPHQLVQAPIREALANDFIRLSPKSGSEEPALWWLPRKQFTVTPVHERVEQAVFNVLNTSPATLECSLHRVVRELFPGHLAPQRAWVRACLDSYGVESQQVGWTLRPEDQLQKRTLEHARMVAMLAKLGHDFDFKVWIGAEQQKQSFDGGVLGDLLTPAERRFGPGAILGSSQAESIDVVWYHRGPSTYVFEVEWMTVFFEAVRVRAARGGNVNRFLVVPEERANLIQAKLHTFPWVEQALADGAWQFIKFQHLLSFVGAQSDRNPYSLGKIVGLRPAVEQDRAQLRLF